MYPRSFLCEEAKVKQRSPLRGGVRDNLKQKTLFSLIFYGDTARTNVFKLFLNYKASSEEYLVKFS